MQLYLCLLERIGGGSCIDFLVFNCFNAAIVLRYGYGYGCISWIRGEEWRTAEANVKPLLCFSWINSHIISFTVRLTDWGQLAKDKVTTATTTTTMTHVPACFLVLAPAHQLSAQLATAAYKLQHCYLRVSLPTTMVLQSAPSNEAEAHRIGHSRMKIWIALIVMSVAMMSSGIGLPPLLPPCVNCSLPVKTPATKFQTWTTKRSHPIMNIMIAMMRLLFL